MVCEVDFFLTVVPMFFVDDQLLTLICACTDTLHSSSDLTLYLRPIPSASGKRLNNEEEIVRTGFKVDRSLEKLRRLSIKVIEFYAASPHSLSSSSIQIDSAIHRLLLACVTCLQSVLSDQVCIIL